MRSSLKAIWKAKTIGYKGRLLYDDLATNFAF